MNECFYIHLPGVMHKCKKVTGYCYFYKLCHFIVFLVELQPPYDYGRGYRPVPQYPPEQRGYAPAPPVLSQQSNSVRPHLQFLKSPHV